MNQQQPDGPRGANGDLIQQLRSRQRFLAAAIAGGLAGVAGAFIWGSLTGISGLHIEFTWMPMIGIGFLVGKAIAVVGRGVDLRFCVLGAAIAAIACLAGYAFSVLIATAWQVQLGSNFYLLEQGRLDAWLRLSKASFGWADGFCLSVSMYEGFRFARLPVARASLEGAPPRWSPTLVVVLVVAFPAVVGITWLSVSRESIRSVDITNQGQIALLKTTIDGGGEVEIWDVPAGQLVTVIGQSSPTIRAMAVSLEENLLATVTRRTEAQPRPGERGLASYGQIGLWDAKTGELQENLQEHTDAKAHPLLTPEGRQLLVSDKSPVVAVWDLTTMRQSRLEHDADVTGMTLDGTGKTLVTATASGLHVWDLVTKRKRKAIPFPAITVSGIALAADGSLLVVVFPFDRMVQVVDVNAARTIATVTSSQDWVTGAAFSPDGKQLAVSGGSFKRNGQVELWDVVAQRKIRDLPVRTNTVRCVSFSRDGKEVFAGSAQSCRLTQTFTKGSVHRWNAATGEELASIGK